MPDEHPIVERPYWLWEPRGLNKKYPCKMKWARDYIEQTEAERDYWRARAEANSVR